MRTLFEYSNTIAVLSENYSAGESTQSAANNYTMLHKES